MVLSICKYSVWLSSEQSQCYNISLHGYMVYYSSQQLTVANCSDDASLQILKTIDVQINHAKKKSCSDYFDR